MNLDTEKKKKIIRGLVEKGNKWVGMDEACRMEALRRKKIQEGYVFFNNQWITIDEKLNLLQSKTPAKETAIPQMNITINLKEGSQTIQQDMRTFVDQKHLHVNGQIVSNEKPMIENQAPAKNENLPVKSPLSGIHIEVEELKDPPEKSK